MLVISFWVASLMETTESPFLCEFSQKDFFLVGSGHSEKELFHSNKFATATWTRLDTLGKAGWKQHFIIPIIAKAWGDFIRDLANKFSAIPDLGNISAIFAPLPTDAWLQIWLRQERSNMLRLYRVTLKRLSSVFNVASGPRCPSLKGLFGVTFQFNEDFHKIEVTTLFTHCMYWFFFLF